MNRRSLTTCKTDKFSYYSVIELSKESELNSYES